MKKFLKFLFMLIGGLVFVIAAYFAYLEFNYYRIDDNTDLTAKIENNQSQLLKTGVEYSAITSNFGFGAYDHEFSFFLDTGVMEDGTEVKGERSIARSKDAVLANVKRITDILKEQDPDFVVMQEVDFDSDRAYHVNQVEMIKAALANYASVFDINLHSSYIVFPLYQPHGTSLSGLLSLSKYNLQSAVHRQLYVTKEFVSKFVDLDRCLTILRIPVENNKELVLLNVHLSAYDKGGMSREKQMEFLVQLMDEEYAKGNYVILAGDYNHTLSDAYPVLPTKQQKPEWVVAFPEEKLSEKFRIIHSSNVDRLATHRAASITYQEGVNYKVVVDGFIVSDNIEANSEIIDANFSFSDHNPVRLNFILK